MRIAIKKYKEIVPMLLVIVGIFIFFLLVNYRTPLMGEDIVLVPWGKTNNPSSLDEAITNILERINRQMFEWNARLGEQLSIFFAALPKNVFNVLNSLVAMGYIYLLYIYAFKRKLHVNTYNAVPILISFSMIILAQPALGEIFFWRTGSTNYLWGISILLLFGIPIRFYIGNNSIDIMGKSRIKIIGLTILGFFAGITNENTVIVFIFIYVFAIINNKIKKIKVPIWIYMSFCTLLSGILFLCFIPSTRKRAATYDEIYGIDYMEIGDYVVRIGNIIYRFFYDNIVLILLTIFALVLYIICIMKKINMPKSQKKKLFFDSSENLLLLFSTSIACGALIMVPYVETRAFLISDFFMMVCILFYLEQTYKLCVHKKIAVKTLVIILFCTISLEGGHILNVYNSYWKFNEKRNSAIEAMGDNRFIWGRAYPQIDYASRILTTREDYLLDKDKNLSYFYGKEIKCWRNYLWEFENNHLRTNFVEGDLNTFVYDDIEDLIYVWGWAAFVDEDTSNNSYYLYLDYEMERYYFETEKVLREDVAEVYDNKIYLKSGFICKVEKILEVLGYECDLKNIQIGVCVIDEENGWIGEIAPRKLQFVNKD